MPVLFFTAQWVTKTDPSTHPYSKMFSHISNKVPEIKKCSLFVFFPKLVQEVGTIKCHVWDEHSPAGGRESRACPHVFLLSPHLSCICTMMTYLGLKARDISLAFRSSELGIKQNVTICVTVFFGKHLISLLWQTSIHAHFLYNLLSIRKQILNSVVILGQARKAESWGRGKGWDPCPAVQTSRIWAQWTPCHLCLVLGTLQILEGLKASHGKSRWDL